MARRRDPRPERSQRALVDALLALLDDHDLSDITPGDVAARAGVGRSTFYDRFPDMHALARLACTKQFDDLLTLAPTEMLTDIDSLRTRLELFFSHIQSNRRLYVALLGSGGSSQLSSHLRNRLASAIQHAATPEGRQPVSRFGAAFLAGGLVTVAQSWLEDDLRRTTEELSRDVADVVFGSSEP